MNELDQQRIEEHINETLARLGGNDLPSFTSTIENAYEVYTLAYVMEEYYKKYGAIKKLVYPKARGVLNQGPGRFRKEKAFYIEFSAEAFYFACDIEAYGLEAFSDNRPIGSKFEIDVVVISADKADDVIDNFNSYPAPQHIHSAYECKFGKYEKGQVREILGLKRHLTFMNTTPHPVQIMGSAVTNSRPPIVMKMIRPFSPLFLESTTATLHDLEQIVL